MNTSVIAIDNIRAAVARRPAELAVARQAGKKVVGWIGYNIPEELIHACGLIPIRICQGGDNRLAEIGANYISTQNCFFLRQCIGLFVERQDPYVRELDALATDTTCLQLYRMATLLEHYFQTNVIFLGVPKNREVPEADAYFTQEVGQFLSQMEKMAGRPLDEGSLTRTLKLFAGIRQAITQLYEYLANDRPLISWRDVLEVVQAGYCLDRAQYLILLQELLGELAERAAAPCRTVERRVRVLLAGSLIARGDTKLITILEECGARVVGDLIWSGMAPFVNLAVKEYSLAGLVAAYYSRLPHGAIPHMEVDNDDRLIVLQELAKKTRANGIVYYSLRYCDPFSFKVLCTKNAMKRIAVPLMEAQTEYSPEDTENLRTRVEAFVEMLDCAQARREWQDE